MVIHKGLNVQELVKKTEEIGKDEVKGKENDKEVNIPEKGLEHY